MAYLKRRRELRALRAHDPNSSLRRGGRNFTSRGGCRNGEAPILRRGTESSKDIIRGVTPEGDLLLYWDMPRLHIDLDMRIDDDRPKRIESQKQWRRRPMDTKFMLRATPQHRHQEWKSTLYRRANDIDKDTTPALKKYEWGMEAKKTPWRGYKKMENGTARNSLLGANLIDKRMYRGWK